VRIARKLSLAAAPADLRLLESFSSTSRPNLALIEPVGYLSGIVPRLAAHPVRRDASSTSPLSQRHGMQVCQFAEFGRGQRGIAITKVLDDAHAS
jgi:hypothetical protein